MTANDKDASGQRRAVLPADAPAGVLTHLATIAPSGGCGEEEAVAALRSLVGQGVHRIGAGVYGISLTGAPGGSDQAAALARRLAVLLGEGVVILSPAVRAGPDPALRPADPDPAGACSPGPSPDNAGMRAVIDAGFAIAAAELKALHGAAPAPARPREARSLAAEAVRLEQIEARCADIAARLEAALDRSEPASADHGSPGPARSDHGTPDPGSPRPGSPPQPSPQEIFARIDALDSRIAGLAVADLPERVGALAQALQDRQSALDTGLSALASRLNALAQAQAAEVAQAAARERLLRYGLSELIARLETEDTSGI